MPLSNTNWDDVRAFIEDEGKMRDLRARTKSDLTCFDG